MLNLSGRHAVVFGVASEESLAWGVARQLHKAGARISLGYQHRFKSRVRQLLKSGDVPVAYSERCDLTCPDELDHFFKHLEGPVDMLVHSVAYANPEALARPFRDLEQGDFVSALTASAYSLVPVTQAALPSMTRGGSIIAMSYLGGHRVVANYKLMGVAKAALEAIVRELAADLGPSHIRVNAISAGPVRTLAASQVPRFDEMMKVYEQVAPMRRTISQEDVGNMAAFLGSDLARNVTGQTLFVDGGYSILAMAELPR
jgi:enoyl-[acyl-carrier protein] reductase I